MTLPLSKLLDPADFDQLTEELRIVDEHFYQDRAQHLMRRWEYAMALRAIDVWWAQKTLNVTRIADVGGAGSPFYRMAGPDQTYVIDPEENSDLAFYLRSDPRLAQVVTCLSVLEHVDDLDSFLYHLSCLVAPGGLLVLTMDYCDGGMTSPDGWPADRYHFHWMRKRIFNWHMVQRLWMAFDRREFSVIGNLSRSDYGGKAPAVYDYTFASLALQKRA